MNIQSLRFRPISHLLQGELVQFLSVISQQTARQLFNHKTSMPPSQNEPSQQNLQLGSSKAKGKSTSNLDQINGKNAMKQSIVQQFFGPTKNLQITKLKQQCNKLRFQKLALESAMNSLRDQLGKKDQIIRSLTVKNHVQTHTPPHIGSIRQTMPPIY